MSFQIKFPTLINQAYQPTHIGQQSDYAAPLQNRIVALNTAIIRKSISGDDIFLTTASGGIYEASGDGIPIVHPPLELKTDEYAVADNFFAWSLLEGVFQNNGQHFGTDAPDTFLQLCAISDKACAAFNKEYRGDSTVLPYNSAGPTINVRYTAVYRVSTNDDQSLSDNTQHLPDSLGGCFNWTNNPVVNCLYIPSIER